MSRDSDSFFEELFGAGGLERIFGKGARFIRIPPRVARRMERNASVAETPKKAKGGAKGRAKGKKSRERAVYTESLITELLTTLAGKKLITNDEARDVIAKAKERTKKKLEEQEAAEKQEAVAEKPASHVHVLDEVHSQPHVHHAHDHDVDPPCGGSCPDHDRRPHKTLDCARCKRPTAHLIEGDFGRCRFCLTARLSS